jgi:hypothetical protein
MFACFVQNSMKMQERAMPTKWNPQKTTPTKTIFISLVFPEKLLIDS